jgi:transposase
MLFLSKHNIFKSSYVELLNEYMHIKKADKLKHQSIDSTFVPNQCASNKYISRNKYYKNKKGCKISTIIDKYGIPISVLVGKGSSNDSIFIEEHFENMLIDTKTHQYKNSHRYKQYILADKGYDTSKLRKICTDKGYIDVIDHNKRNTKDKTKIKKFSQKEECIYKKRITIENSFSWIKKNRRLCNVYDKKISVYISFLYMALIKILLKKMHL